MDEGEAKMDGESRLFSQIAIIARLTKNHESYPANSL